MPAEIVMPRLSDSMEEGTILTWMVSLGDSVKRGDELVEIETDKANMVYESDSNGLLVEIVAPEGATLPIGSVIARLGEPGDALVERSAAQTGAAVDGNTSHPAPPIAQPAQEAPPRPAQPGSQGPVDVAPQAGAEGGASYPPAQPQTARTSADQQVAGSGAAPAVGLQGARIKASPIARRIARESGIDLVGLVGSGPGGRIVKTDVETAAAGPAQPVAAAPSTSAPAPALAAASATAAGAGAQERPETAKGQAEIVELTKLQQTVARRMAESKATAPHFYLSSTVDMTRAVAARAQIKSSAAAGEVVPSFNDLIVKACAIALREFPRANGAYRDGRVELYSRVNVGIAVAGMDALVVPTVFDADLKGLRQIATETRALAARVRESSITPPELSGGTFTVSNLGMFGITRFDAVINPPQAGILAVGEIAERPVVRDGEISTAALMEVSLACDHRILYGADGAQFLARIRALLEEPLGLAL